MTVFRTLVSGSSGNAVVFSENGTNILIDCGVSGKCIAALLNEAGIAPDRLNCILVTHEHIDHTNGIGVLSRKYNIPVVASGGCGSISDIIDVFEKTQFFSELKNQKM